MLELTKIHGGKVHLVPGQIIAVETVPTDIALKGEKSNVQEVCTVHCVRISVSVKESEDQVMELFYQLKQWEAALDFNSKKNADKILSSPQESAVPLKSV